MNNYSASEAIGLILFGLFMGLVVGFILSKIYLHFVLRFCFYLEGSMPLRFVDFLEFSTNLRILEQDGGQWRFRHKILQDYFANLETEK